MVAVEATAMPPEIGSNATDTATQMATIVRAIAMATLGTQQLSRPAVQEVRPKTAWADGGHNGKHGGAILPESLTWLWRDDAKKEKGETMLTLFHLTGFERPPEDFGKVLAQTRKDYPPENKK